MVPASSGGPTPAMSRKRVDLPQPLGPRRQVIRPPSSCKWKSSKTLRVPKARESPSMIRAGAWPWGKNGGAKSSTHLKAGSPKGMEMMHRTVSRAEGVATATDNGTGDILFCRTYRFFDTDTLGKVCTNGR